MRDSCYGCPDRTTICHGKDEQGNWRCKDWARMQEKKEKEEQQKQALRDIKGYFKAKKQRIVGPRK